MQRQMPFLSEARQPALVPQDLLSLCVTKLDAVRLCIQLSRLPHAAISESLAIDKGHWSRIMQGQAHFPTNKEGDLMRLCGNYAPLQWAANEAGFDLNARDERAQRIAELEKQLEAARRAA